MPFCDHFEPLLSSADEHVQTTGPEHGDRHSPRPAKGVAEKQHAGLLELDAQPSVASTRLPEGAAPKVSAPVQVRRAHIRTPTQHRAPNQEPGRILIPGDGAAGDQEAQNRPACAAIAATRRLRPVPSQRFLALRCQAHTPSCSRQVTSTSIRMVRPGPASAPRGHAPLRTDTLSLARTISDRRLWAVGCGACPPVGRAQISWFWVWQCAGVRAAPWARCWFRSWSLAFSGTSAMPATQDGIPVTEAVTAQRIRARPLTWLPVPGRANPECVPCIWAPSPA